MAEKARPDGGDELLLVVFVGEWARVLAEEGGGGGGCLGRVGGAVVERGG